MRHTLPLLFLVACSPAPEGDGPAPSRIVGGVRTNIEVFPHQVSLTSDQGLRCGGSIVASRWVVTAAHCVADDPAGLSIAAGETRLSAIDDDERIDVTRIVLHPGYDGASPPHDDVALLHLAEALPLGTLDIDAIAPVTPQEAEDGLTDPGVIATVSGWGALASSGPLSDVLRSVDLPIVDNAEASESYGQPITGELLAAGGSHGGKDACAGDSGSPLVVPGDDGVWRLAGIVSWGHGCGEPNTPGVYTRVSYVHDWLTRTIHGHAPPECDVGEWACGDGTCIDAAWTCDGGADCDDATDEEDCGSSWACDDDELLCDESWCIPAEWVCDGGADCDDATDEEDCE